MILSKELNIHINSNNYTRYKGLGYDCNMNSMHLISIKDISPTSAYKIDVSCDICHIENNIKYYNYTISYNFGLLKLYTCKKCSYLKKKITTMDRYGVDNISQLKEIKLKKQQTSIKNYGTTHTTQASEVKDKIKLSMIERYGVDNPTKHPEFFIKAQKNSYKKFNYKDTQLVYQGSYELDFIEYCLHNDIDIENGPIINYMMNDKNRCYHSDFIIKSLNLIVEVKSQWTYNCDIEENKAKQLYSILSGYNHIFLIDKDYSVLSKISI